MCANKALLEPWKVPYICHIYGLNCIVLVVTTQPGHFGPNLVTLGHLMTFLGTKRPDSGLIGASKGHYLRILWHFLTPRGTPKFWKWVSDAYPVSMGQLDHHVVFGTKSGALHDFQRGKKCPMGVKQTPV